MIEHGSGKNHEAKTRLLPNMFASPEEGLLNIPKQAFCHNATSGTPAVLFTKTLKLNCKKLQGGISGSTYLYYPPSRCTLLSMSAQVVDDVGHPRTLIGGDKLSHLTAQPMLAPIYGQIVHRA